MNRIPLIERLKKKYQRRIAYAQDLIVIEIYNLIPDVVLHGGIVIWRCYGANRFSEDVDAIIPVKYHSSNKLIEFKNRIEKVGFKVEKFRVKKNSLYSRLLYSGIETRLEGIFRNVYNWISKPYEMVDGVFMYIYTLPVEDMLIEKVNAYLSRRLVRDLYDITILIRYVKDVDRVRDSLLKLVDNYRDPVDEKQLKLLILSGAVPKVSSLIGEIRRWVRKNM